MPPPGRRGYQGPSAEQAAKKAQALRDLAKRKADQARQQKLVAYQAARRRAEAKAQQSYANQVAQQRIQQTQRRDAASAAAAAQQAKYKARGEAMQKSRLAHAASVRRTHTVTRDDTPESIAKQDGIEPSAVGKDVARLRPGQRLTFDALAPAPAEGAQVPAPAQYQDISDAERAGYQTEAGRYTGDVTPAWEGVMGAMESFAQYGGLQGKLAKQGAKLMPTLMSALGRIGITLGEGGGEFFGADTQAMGEWGEQMTQYGEEMAGSPAYMSFVGAEMQQADLSRYNVARRVPGGIHDQMEEAITEAQQAKGNFGGMVRYTGQALAYAHEAMVNGDPDWRKILESTMPGREGEITMFLTDNRWDTGPMWEQFSPEMRENILELGFVEVEPGLWMMPTLEEADYGMGGFEFPGYGGGFGGFGGGGGDYEYLSRGGVQRRRAGGGVSAGERYRIFPEGVSPAHWRI